jgi:hypothetical protein
LHHSQRSKSPIEELNFGHAANPSHPSRKRKTLRQLDSAARLQVVKLASSKTKTCNEIALIFNIKVQAVYDLSKDLKKKQVYFVKKKEAELKRVT